MSVDFYLSPTTHDLQLSRAQDLQLATGAQRIAQQVKVTLLTFLGEWFLDETFGVPYLEVVTVKSPQRAQIESVMRAKVKAVPGVEAVPTVQIDIDAPTRRVRITLPDIQSAEGVLPLISVAQ